MTGLILTLLAAALLLTAMVAALLDARRQATVLTWTRRDDELLDALVSSRVDRLR